VSADRTEGRYRILQQFRVVTLHPDLSVLHAGVWIAPKNAQYLSFNHQGCSGLGLVLPAQGAAVAGCADFPLKQGENLRVLIIWKISAGLDILPVREPVDCGPGDGRGGGVGNQRDRNDELVFSVTVQIPDNFTKVRG
jgi:hypothetical protein